MAKRAGRMRRSAGTGRPDQILLTAGEQDRATDALDRDDRPCLAWRGWAGRTPTADGRERAATERPGRSAGVGPAWVRHRAEDPAMTPLTRRGKNAPSSSAASPPRDTPATGTRWGSTPGWVRSTPRAPVKYSREMSCRVWGRPGAPGPGSDSRGEPWAASRAAAMLVVILDDALQVVVGPPPVGDAQMVIEHFPCRSLSSAPPRRPPLAQLRSRPGSRDRLTPVQVAGGLAERKPGRKGG
jgi:hypothetical protein